MTAVGDSVPKPLRFIRFGDSRWNIEKRRHFCRRFPPFYLTACVRSLPSVALFGCNFSIVRNLAIIAFTRFIFRNRFSSRSTTSFFSQLVNLQRIFRRADNVVDTRAEGVREFQAEIYGLAAYSADLLRGVYLFLVAFKLRPLRAVMVGAQVRLCHFAHLLSDL